MFNLRTLPDRMYLYGVRLLVTLCSVTSLCSGVSLNVVTVSENDLTCWTCPNKTDNEACNNWAPDVNCPLNYTWCVSIHRVDVMRGKSLIVHKKCALPSACSKGAVGCRETDDPGIQECVSCCNVAYCNEAIPFNHTAAIQLSTIQPSAAAANHMSRYNLMLTILTAFLLVISRCCHGDELLAITTEIKTVLLCSVTMVAIVLNMTSDVIFMLPCRWLWKVSEDCGAKTGQSVLSYSGVAPSNHSRNIYVSDVTIRNGKEALLNNSWRTILSRFCDFRDNTNNQDISVS